MNCGIIITIEMLEIRIIDIKVITKENHLGIDKIPRILPVIVQRAIAIIIDAKIRMSISFRLHKINIEIINTAIDSQLVGFNLNCYWLESEFAYLLAKRINLSNSFSEFQL